MPLKATWLNAAVSLQPMRKGYVAFTKYLTPYSIFFFQSSNSFEDADHLTGNVR
jgi:hypothetical protein